LVMTRTEQPWPAPGACGARVPAGCAPPQCLPRASCNWRGLVQLVQWRYLACDPGGRGQRVVAPQALRPLWGARVASRVAHPCPGSRDQGSPGPAGRAETRRWLEPPAACVVSRWQTRVEIGDLRRPISCPIRPGYTRAYGVPGPVALSAARAGACVSDRWFACRAARERARCGECGGERRGAAAHPLLPLRTRRRPEERTGRA
jgi:hypothetical protein